MTKSRDLTRKRPTNPRGMMGRKATSYIFWDHVGAPGHGWCHKTLSNRENDDAKVSVGIRGCCIFRNNDAANPMPYNTVAPVGGWFQIQTTHFGPKLGMDKLIPLACNLKWAHWIPSGLWKHLVMARKQRTELSLSLAYEREFSPTMPTSWGPSSG